MPAKKQCALNYFRLLLWGATRLRAATSLPALLAVRAPLHARQSPTHFLPSRRPPSSECANARPSVRGHDFAASYSVASLCPRTRQRFSPAARACPLSCPLVRASCFLRSHLRARQPISAHAPCEELPSTTDRVGVGEYHRCWLQFFCEQKTCVEKTFLSLRRENCKDLT